MKKSKVKKSNSKKDFGKLSIAAHAKTGGKLELTSKFKLKNKDDLSIAYTPGVASVCMQIFNDKNTSTNKYTLKKNTIAVVSDGSAVLGLGNIGASASIPVMEGKSVLMKHFAGVDAFPICLDTQDTEEIIKTVKLLQPVFGGINLEDISAPRCFEIEERLRKELNIPVMHDDQWGAATVTVAALINALKVVRKNAKDISIALIGAGAAGIATARLIETMGVKNLTVFDTKGAINSTRSDLNHQKKYLIHLNKLDLSGELRDNMQNFDVFIGLSKPNLLTVEDVTKMKKDPIIFALANPSPEILPVDAYRGGAKVVGTGRSDFPNQINNSVFFPGFWRGMLDRQNKGIVDAKEYDTKMLIKCAEAIAKMIKPTAQNILPNTLDKKVHTLVAKTVLNYKK
jgi:malate dehydrogenase (oxaloacetate-decarboxylating)